MGNFENIERRVRTKRFGLIWVSKVFEKSEDATAEGFTEPTGNIGIRGKTLGMISPTVAKMAFCAVLDDWKKFGGGKND